MKLLKIILSIMGIILFVTAMGVFFALMSGYHWGTPEFAGVVFGVYGIVMAICFGIGALWYLASA